ncbi:MAG: hypothetical protein K2Q10_09850, partial [Rhodospirillales bacterium]|nr:hypothetical protein [Rhodospirillales bacterium]
YEEDSQFRELVSRYLGEFESLLDMARKSERPDILTAVFTSAEVGKLYLLLARALGRVEE